MSIKSDKWIRRMAQKGMIEPFEPGQVKTVEGKKIEYFRIPRNVLTICLGKSTYARCGIIVNVTPLEPEWEGHVTLEFSNSTPLLARIYANEGVAQVLFLESDEVCETSYRDRGGKYQGQKGVTLPRIFSSLALGLGYG
jgi:deoxycytidine triphosphate deaminase